jgi:hypothetical protein
MTSSGENGGRASRMQSTTTRSPSRWEIASVKLSSLPPEGSVKA